MKTQYDEQMLLEEYDEKANKLMSRTMRYLMIFAILTLIANIIGIFAIENWIMYTCTGLCLIAMGIPTILIDYLHIKGNLVSYFVLSLIVITVGVYYALLSYHVILMFALPVILSCIYMDQKYPLYTTLFSIPVFIISHLIAFDLKLVPDEPLVTLRGVIVYGILPRMLIFLCISVVCINIAQRTRTLLNDLMSNTKKVCDNSLSIHSLVEASDNLIAVRNYKELSLATLFSMESITKAVYCNDNEDHFSCLVGICDPEHLKHFYLFDDKKGEINPSSSLNTTENDLLVFYNQETFHIPLTYDSGDNEIFFYKQYTIMSFYYNSKLAGFMILGITLDDYGNEHLDLLRINNSYVSKALTNVILNYQLIGTQKELVCSLAEMSEFKSRETGQHVKRVGEYMLVIGKALGLSEDECEILSMASMLHDIGKLLIPSDILDKPARLTDEEFEVVKTHVNIGRNLLEKCSGAYILLAKDIAYQHHEKWNGTGYLGYKGDEINLYARYVAIVDVFDALVSNRSYKKAWSVDEAYNEIVSQEGRHFDPEVVQVFKAHFDEFVDILKTYPDA